MSHSSGDRHIVVAAVALVRAGHVLTVRKRGTHRFMLVGGKLEPGEGPREAALRETREEVGVEVVGAELIGEFLSEAANEPGHTLHSTVFLVGPDQLLGQEPEAAGEIEEIRWLPFLPGPGGLPADLAPMLEHDVIPVLRERYAGQRVPDGGGEGDSLTP